MTRKDSDKSAPSPIAPLIRIVPWNFPPVQQFISPASCVPLPQKVLVGGTSFYDWDTWCTALLHPDLWKAQGSWERLIRSIHVCKPRPALPQNLLKNDLIRVIVTHIVSVIVGRHEDNLIADDRNWIAAVIRTQTVSTSKLTLSVLLDLAFMLYELVACCRIPHNPISVLHISYCNVPATVSLAYARIVELINCNSVTLPNSPQSSSSTNSGVTNTDKSVNRFDNVIDHAMHIIHRDIYLGDSYQTGLYTEVTHRIRHVTNALQLVVDNFPCRYPPDPLLYFSSYNASTDDVCNCLLQNAATVFVNSFHLKPQLDGKFDSWVAEAMNTSTWLNWIQLAHDFTYIQLLYEKESICIPKCQFDLCEKIVLILAAHQPVNSSNEYYGNLLLGLPITTTPTLYFARNQRIQTTINLTLELVLRFDMFFKRLIEECSIHKNPMSAPNKAIVASSSQAILRTLHAFERLILQLAVWRSVVFESESHEKVKIGWSARALNMGKVYTQQYSHVSILPPNIVEYAVISAFAEASWPTDVRTARYMKVPHLASQTDSPLKKDSPSTEDSNDKPTAVKKKEMEKDSANEGPKHEKNKPVDGNPIHWVSDVDLHDSLNRAIVIAPWNPQYALKLIDEAIGLDETQQKNFMSNGSFLPLLDYRRFEICRELISRRDTKVRVLGMERLQCVFRQTDWHTGGAFSKQTISILRKSTQEGNVSALATLGMIYAADDENGYWKTARQMAQCRQLKREGFEMLLNAAKFGDLEASISLTHILGTIAFSCGRACPGNRTDDSDLQKTKNSEPESSKSRSSLNTQSSHSKGYHSDKMEECGSDKMEERGQQNILLKQNTDLDTLQSVLNYDQLFHVFKLALESQNSEAIYNLALVWKFGLKEIVLADEKIALDCALTALQSTRRPETRSMVIEYLKEYCKPENKEVTSALKTFANALKMPTEQLSLEGTRSEAASHNSPSGIGS